MVKKITPIRRRVTVCHMSVLQFVKCQWYCVTTLCGAAVPNKYNLPSATKFEGRLSKFIGKQLDHTFSHPSTISRDIKSGDPSHVK